MSASTPAIDGGAGRSADARAEREIAPGEDRALLETRNRPLLIVGVLAVSICQFLDATIANVALPHMRAALGASSDQISWVLTTFIISTAIATPITGWLSDRVGSRNLFLFATILFLATSAACGAAMSLSQMVVFRAIQGVAAAFIGPMTLTIMFDISPPSKQAMTMAIFSMIVMVAPISGPFLGGLLTEYLNWRWIFYVNLPLGVPALFLIWWLLPSRPIERRKLDLFGFAMIALALGSLQLMLDRGQHNDWFDSWETIVELVVALSAFWIFVVHSRTTPSPLFKRALYANTNYVMSLAFMGVLGMAVVGLSSVLPMMFQSIYGYPVMDTGLMMAPRGFGVMISSLFAGFAARYVDPRQIMALGFLIAAGAMWSMTGWSLDMDSRPIILASFVQGIGFGLVVSPMNLLAFATLDPKLRPDGSSLTSLFRSFGGSIGISIIVALLARNQQISHADLAGHVSGTIAPGFDLPAVIDRLPGVGAAIPAMIDAEVTRQAMMISFLDIFFLLSCVLVAFTPLPFLLKRPPRMDGGHPPPSHE